MIKLLENEDSSNGAELLIPFDEKIVNMEEIEPQGVYKRIINRGSGPVIKPNNAIVYHYTAYLENLDEPFDSSILRGKPHYHRLDQDSMVPGLMIGILTMKKGEKSEIVIYPKYGFGELGVPPRIPGDSSILYIVQIIQVFQEGTLSNFSLMSLEEQEKFSFDEIIKMCNVERISGNTYFKDERYKEASLRYRKAILVLEQYAYKSAEDEKEANELLSKLYPNIANTYIKLKKLRPAMTYSKRALLINPNNIKALYHYGTAKYMNADYDEAKDLLLRAKKLKPTCTAIDSALQKLEHRIKLDSITEHNLYKKMSSLFYNDKANLAD